jgi:hypothetical protein
MAFWIYSNLNLNDIFVLKTQLNIKWKILKIGLKCYTLVKLSEKHEWKKKKETPKVENERIALIMPWEFYNLTLKMNYKKFLN